MANGKWQMAYALSINTQKMSNLKTRFDTLNYLARTMAGSDSFEIDARTFADLVQDLREDIYASTSSTAVLDRLDQIPDLDLAPHQRSFMEQLLPGNARSMVGNYQVKQKILAQVQDISRAFNRIRDLLPIEPAQDDLV